MGHLSPLIDSKLKSDRLSPELIYESEVDYFKTIQIHTSSNTIDVQLLLL